MLVVFGSKLRTTTEQRHNLTGRPREVISDCWDGGEYTKIPQIIYLRNLRNLSIICGKSNEELTTEPVVKRRAKLRNSSPACLV
jgi:hypothetical protein